MNFGTLVRGHRENLGAASVPILTLLSVLGFIPHADQPAPSEEGTALGLSLTPPASDMRWWTWRSKPPSLDLGGPGIGHGGPGMGVGALGNPGITRRPSVLPHSTRGSPAEYRKVNGGLSSHQHHSRSAVCTPFSSLLTEHHSFSVPSLG